MKKLLLGAVAVATVFGGAATANAADGCGRGAHRGAYGHCRPNDGPAFRHGYGPGYRGGYGPGYGAVEALRIGVFYPGHGWWDGRRYWGHRDRWHGGWRYR